MRTKDEIRQFAYEGGDLPSTRALIVIAEALLDIRDLLANPPEENVKQEVRCKECQNDNHGGCTGCTCHADY